jgi:hypothetical protein
VFDGCGFDAHLGVYSSSLARLPTLRTRWGTPLKATGSTQGFQRLASFLDWATQRRRGGWASGQRILLRNGCRPTPYTIVGVQKRRATCDLLAIATVSCIKKRGARACMHTMCLRRILLSRLFLATIVTRHLPFCYQRSPIFKYQDEKGFIKEHLLISFSRIWGNFGNAFPTFPRVSWMSYLN